MESIHLPSRRHCLPSVGLDVAVPTPELQGWSSSPQPACHSMAPSGCWRGAALDANAERAAPADSTITQGSPSLLLNRKHFSVSFPLPLELKPPFCSKTHQAKEILLPFQLANSPPSSISRNAHPTVHPLLGVHCTIGGTSDPHPCPPTGTLETAGTEVLRGLQDSVLSMYSSCKYSQIRQKAKPALGSPPLALPEGTSLAWPAPRLS